MKEYSYILVFVRDFFRVHIFLRFRVVIRLLHCTEVGFVDFLSGGFTTNALINPPERKWAKHISVHCIGLNCRYMKAILLLHKYFNPLLCGRLWQAIQVRLLLKKLWYLWNFFCMMVLLVKKTCKHSKEKRYFKVKSAGTVLQC